MIKIVSNICKLKYNHSFIPTCFGFLYTISRGCFDQICQLQRVVEGSGLRSCPMEDFDVRNDNIRNTKYAVFGWSEYLKLDIISYKNEEVPFDKVFDVI
jgi:hypothetical protein